MIIYNNNIILNFFVTESEFLNEKSVSQVLLNARSFFINVETEERYVKILIILQ